MSNHPTPFDRALQRVADSGIPDDILSRSMAGSLARSIASRNYKLYAGSLAEFLAFTLDHRAGSKEGSVFLPAILKGQGRNDGNVALLLAIVLDVDEGNEIKNVKCRLNQLGWVYSIYTSHSDGKTVTTVPVADLISKIALADESDISSDVLQFYLREHRTYDEAIWSTIKGFTLECDEKGRRLVRVDHAPIRKFRVVIPLDVFFDPDRHRSLAEAKRAWAGYLEAVARALDVKFDRACVDLSRAFFLPRHSEGRPFEVHVGGTHLLDLAELEPVERQDEGMWPAAASPRARCSIPMSSAGDADGRPWLRDYLRRKGRSLDIVGWLTEEIGWETRGAPTNVKAAILCPNDDAHSNPGTFDDTACVAMNPEATDHGRAIITCRHAHCQHLRTYDFLNMIFDQIDIQELNA